MDQEQLNQEIMEEMKELQAEQGMDSQQDSMIDQQSFQEAYGYPEAEEKQNQHSFLHKATFDSPDNIKTTFLQEGELGRPLFNVRFLLDIHDICLHYIDPLCDEAGLGKENNKIAKYFWEKIQNIAASGMSNKGFAMNLNAMRKIEVARKREANLVQNQK